MRIDKDDGGDPVFLPERLLESCEDDTELAQEVLQDYRVSAPLGLSRMAAAVEAADAVLVRLEAQYYTRGFSGVATLAAPGLRLSARRGTPRPEPVTAGHNITARRGAVPRGLVP